MDVNSLPKTVTRQHCSCDLNPRSTAPESNTLTTRLPNHSEMCVYYYYVYYNSVRNHAGHCNIPHCEAAVVVLVHGDLGDLARSRSGAVVSEPSTLHTATAWDDQLLPQSSTDSLCLPCSMSAYLLHSLQRITLLEVADGKKLMTDLNAVT